MRKPIWVVFFLVTGLFSFADDVSSMKAFDQKFVGVWEDDAAVGLNHLRKNFTWGIGYYIGNVSTVIDPAADGASLLSPWDDTNSIISYKRVTPSITVVSATIHAGTEYTSPIEYRLTLVGKDRMTFERRSPGEKAWEKFPRELRRISGPGVPDLKLRVRNLDDPL